MMHCVFVFFAVGVVDVGISYGGTRGGRGERGIERE